MRVSETDVFLSYARQDRALARVIAEGLRQEGLTVWWDASLRSGETFDEVIERNLKEAHAVVVLWSPASVASRWVRAEATLADRRNKLVPAIIAACDRPIIFELTHTAELIAWEGDRSDTRWRTFVEDLRRLTGIGSAEIRSTEAEESQSGAAKAQEIEHGAAGAAPGMQPCSADKASRRDSPIHQSAARAIASLDDRDVHCLAIEAGELPEELFVIDSAGARIGRTAPADIILPHRSISREHCIIGIANDELLVTDLNSTNGTFVDGVRISRATVLPLGSTLRIGEISLRHAIGAPDETRQLILHGEPGAGHAGRFARVS